MSTSITRRTALSVEGTVWDRSPSYPQPVPLPGLPSNPFHRPRRTRAKFFLSFLLFLLPFALIYSPNLSMTFFMRDKKNLPPPGAVGFSACLLVKDDNHRLPEWIAYHFLALPLRRLIVAVDPTSRTSPAEILGRWNGTEDLEGRTLLVTQWTDVDFMSADQISLVQESDEGRERLRARYPNEKNLFTHKERQRIFIRNCFGALKAEGMHWTVHVDSDEFVTFNRRARGDPDPPLLGSNTIEGALVNERSIWNMKKIGTQLEEEKARREGGPLMVKYEKTMRERRTGVKTRENIRDKLPTLESLVTLEDFIHLHQRLHPFSKKGFMMPRLFFFGRPLDNTHIAAGPDDGIDRSTFDTLRFRSHATKGAFLYNTFGKTMMDVSRITESDLVLDKGKRIRQVHNLLVPYDTRDMYIGNREKEPYVLMPYSAAPFRVHHYLGTWESYSKRDDARRSRKTYDKMNDVPIAYDDDDITSWLGVLIKMMGTEKVAKLTAGSGVIA